MKDIIVTVLQQKNELQILLGCFVFAFLINIVAIIIYKTPWFEVFTQLGYVIAVAVILYLFILFVRFVVYLLKFWFPRHKKQ